MRPPSITCPRCRSDAVYRYGRIATGKRRYICLICNRQFVCDSSWKNVARRPICPKCGKTMHVFMREADCIRFRCSQYPMCRTFVKLPKEADKSQ
ncbi:MAG: IS1 family transposase [Deltaproteobacteria bacterium]|nr:IS1 family transposase [Deltaproteobacteria bacterium]